jgi:uncharacterized membrane protein YoaK (UPF0700 family)
MSDMYLAIYVFGLVPVFVAAIMIGSKENSILPSDIFTSLILALIWPIMIGLWMSDVHNALNRLDEERKNVGSIHAGNDSPY